MRGGCHCGAIAIDFVPAAAPATLPLLACQCGFCRRHGTRATADAQGLLTITLHRPALLERYVFGLRTAEYLLCRGCGVYVAAVCAAGEGERGLVNINCLDDEASFTQPVRPVDYAGEAREMREARRQQGWTPVRWER